MKTAVRGDLSSHLIHLTQGNTLAEAKLAFESIVNNKKLIGSDKNIRGKFKCVCFSEAPIHIIAQSLSKKEENSFRFAPYGVMVSKKWLFAQGGRPVFYQPESEFDVLPEELKYRHVRYDPNSEIDFTWEREWRIKIDELSLDSHQTTLIVPARQEITEYVNKHTATNVMQSHFLEIPFTVDFKWHFIALTDLGMTGFEHFT